MPGDPDNASLWADADVYVGPTTATDPATIDDDFGVEWGLVGLLDGTFGFVEQRNWDKKDIYAWGGILVRTSRKNFKETKKFVALEDNDTTRELIWPGSGSGQLVVPRPTRVKIAFETREGDVKRRLISAYQAEVEIDGDIKDTEEDLTKYEFLATILPDSSVSPAVLYNEQGNDGPGS